MPNITNYRNDWQRQSITKLAPNDAQPRANNNTHQYKHHRKIPIQVKNLYGYRQREHDRLNLSRRGRRGHDQGAPSGPKSGNVGNSDIHSASALFKALDTEGGEEFEEPPYIESRNDDNTDVDAADDSVNSYESWKARQPGRKDSRQESLSIGPELQRLLDSKRGQEVNPEEHFRLSSRDRDRANWAAFNENRADIEFVQSAWGIVVQAANEVDQANYTDLEGIPPKYEAAQAHITSSVTEAFRRGKQRPKAPSTDKPRRGGTPPPKPPPPPKPQPQPNPQLKQRNTVSTAPTRSTGPQRLDHKVKEHSPHRPGTPKRGRFAVCNSKPSQRTSSSLVPGPRRHGKDSDSRPGGPSDGRREQGKSGQNSGGSSGVGSRQSTSRASQLSYRRDPITLESSPRATGKPSGHTYSSDVIVSDHPMYSQAEFSVMDILTLLLARTLKTS
jgi:hypothetical protein